MPRIRGSACRRPLVRRIMPMIPAIPMQAMAAVLGSGMLTVAFPKISSLGGITKFAKAHADKDFRLMVKEAFDYALADLGGQLTPAGICSSNESNMTSRRSLYTSQICRACLSRNPPRATSYVTI